MKQSVYFHVRDMGGQPEVIKKELDKLKGVTSVSINTERKNIAVDFDSTAVSGSKIQSELVRMGYEPLSVKTDEHLM